MNQSKFLIPNYLPTENSQLRPYQRSKHDFSSSTRGSSSDLAERWRFVNSIICAYGGNVS